MQVEINLSKRDRLQLTNNEYLTCAIVEQLQDQFLSKPALAKLLGFTKQGAIKLVRKMEARNLIISTGYKRLEVTQGWKSKIRRGTSLEIDTDKRDAMKVNNDSYLCLLIVEAHPNLNKTAQAKIHGFSRVGSIKLCERLNQKGIHVYP